MPWLRLPTEKPRAKVRNLFRQRCKEGDPDCRCTTMNSKMSHLDNLVNENSEIRKSEVDPILILEHRRTVLARFWTT